MFAVVLPVACRLAMATVDSPCPGNSTAIPPAAWQPAIDNTTKKNNHIPYNMKCWKCCPLSSTHFWYLSRKCEFTCINSSSEI